MRFCSYWQRVIFLSTDNAAILQNFKLTALDVTPVEIWQRFLLIDSQWTNE